jgi:hypothetical protein
MSLSNFLENELLDHVMGCGSRDYAPPANIHVGFSTVVPADDGSGLTEPSGGAYARKSTGASDWNIASNNQVTNANEIAFPKATASWGTIRAVCFWDAASGGNLLAYAAIEATEIREGDEPVYEAGQLAVSCTAFSNYLNNELLDHLFGCGSRNWSAPANLYMALSSADPGPSGSGLAEPSGGNYARVSTSAATWAVSANGIVANGAEIAFNAASSPWGTMTHLALLSAASGGNLVAYGPLTTSRVVSLNDVVRFSVGQASVWID